MSGGNRFRYGVVLGVALILAACNRPDLVGATATASPRPLSLAEIQTLVAATMVFEGDLTAAARPSDTPAPELPSATSESTSTSAPTLPPTFAPTSSPTAKPTLVPPTNTPAPAPSSTPKPTDKPTSVPPTNTPCPDLKSATLSARLINSDNDINLVWGSTGGCGPFSGAITAEYEKDSDPFVKYAVSTQSGKLVKRPDVRCEGTFTIVYILTLSDGSGQTIGAKTTLEVFWLC